MSNPTDIDPLLLAQDALRILSVRMDAAPESLPSGQLLRLAEKLAQLELARLQAQPPEPEKAEQTVAEIISLDGLPPGRKMELLLGERLKLVDELHVIDLAIEELEHHA